MKDDLHVSGLPGLGPKTAATIIADLDQVPGIGAKTLDGLRELVGFSGCG